MSGFLLITESTNALPHRTVVEETVPKANLPPTSRIGECRPPGCRSSLLFVERRCHSRCGCPCLCLVSRMVSSPVERERELSSIISKEAPLSRRYILSFDFMIGLGSEVFASSIGEKPLNHLVQCTSAQAPSRRALREMSTLCFVA